MAAQILSVNVTRPGSVTMGGVEVPTTIFKAAVAGLVEVDGEGLRGEQRVSKRLCESADHGVYFYPHEHYAHWQAELDVPGFAYGYFGENVTTVGVMESDVHLGDVLRCGTVTVTVRQPRLPCRKLDARVGRRFAGRFLRSGRSGFFAKVVETGAFSAGDAITVLERDPTEPTIADLLRYTQLEAWDVQGLEALLQSRHLPGPWREIVEHKLELARRTEGWHGLRPLRVTERVAEAEGVLSLWLECPRGRPLAPFSAGQHVIVTWRANEDANALRRPYVLTSDPERLDRYRFTVGRVGSAGAGLPPGVVSAALHDDVRPGDVLLVTAPRGPTALERVPAACKGLLLVSEGIGIASIVPALREWARRLAEVPAVHVHLDQRAASVPFTAELRELERPTLRRILALREPAGDDRPPGLVLDGEPPPLLLRELAARASHAVIAGRTEFVEGIAAQVRDGGAVVQTIRFG
ncbi:MAG: MOSC domain-containing protein [Kofleriaceae bacterium]